MTKNNGKHLPQIEWFYDEDICGSIFPFIGKADLKTLIEWRTSKLNSDTFSYYNKDARNVYFQHLDCIEQCVKILFSNPTPDFSVNELTKQQARRESEEQKAKEDSEDFLSKFSRRDREGLLKIRDRFFK